MRAARVRTDADLLVEGSGDTYGWVSNIGPHANITWGDYDPSNSPQWWMGDDRFDGRPIGPHGPGDPSDMWNTYGWDQRGYTRGGWWNRPSENHGLLPAITKCTQEIVPPIIRTKWRMTINGEHHDDETPLWLRDPMLCGSTPGTGQALAGSASRLTANAFWSTILTHALWWGRGTWVHMLGADEQPLAGSLMILNPFMVGHEAGRWVLDPGGEHPLVTDHDGKFTMNGKVWQVCVVRGLPPNDGHTPEGVLIRHFDTLRLGAAVSKYVLNTFESGIPSGFLKVSTPNFNKPSADKLKAEWTAAHGKGTRSVAVLNSQVDYQPISITPVDADADKISRIALMDVAHAFGLPSTVLDVEWGSMTYANVNDRERTIISRVLGSWAVQLSEVISSVLPYGTSLHIQLSDLLLPPTLDLAERWLPVLQAGKITDEEYRDFIGLPPLKTEHQTAPLPVSEQEGPNVPQ